MSATATRHVKESNSANILMCRQWWKVCWMYGDQEKYYRQLYGRRKTHRNPFMHIDLGDTKQGVQITELTDDFFEQNEVTNHNSNKAVNEELGDHHTSSTATTGYTFGAECEPIYGFNEFNNNTWHRDRRRIPLQQNDYEDYMNETNLDEIWSSGNLNADSIKSMLENGLPLSEPVSKSPPQILDFREKLHKNGNIFGKTSKTVCRTKKGAIVTEETEISTDGKSAAQLKFERSSVQRVPNDVKEVLVPLQEDAVLRECPRRKCVGGELTTTTRTLVTVTQTCVTSCNE